MFQPPFAQLLPITITVLLILNFHPFIMQNEYKHEFWNNVLCCRFLAFLYSGSWVLSGRCGGAVPGAAHVLPDAAAVPSNSLTRYKIPSWAESLATPGCCRNEKNLRESFYPLCSQSVLLNVSSLLLRIHKTLFCFSHDCLTWRYCKNQTSQSNCFIHFH